MKSRFHRRCEKHFLRLLSSFALCRRSPAATTQPPITRVCLPGKMPPHFSLPATSCPLAYVTVFTFHRGRRRSQTADVNALISLAGRRAVHARSLVAQPPIKADRPMITGPSVFRHLRFLGGSCLYLHTFVYVQVCGGRASPHVRI